MTFHTLSRLFFIASACFVLFANAACSEAAGGKRFQRLADRESAAGSPAATFNGRPFKLFVPSAAASAGPMPLLIVLHGGLGNADYMESALGMNPVADRNNLMVAYLNGTGGERKIMQNRRTWNAGACCGPARDQSIDDIGYIANFIDYMIKNRGADPSRIFLMGHSNGSMMAYRYACQHGGINAIVGVSGPLLFDSCPRGAGLKVLHMHGQLDDVVPFNGGRGGKNAIADVTFPSVAELETIMEGSGATFRLEALPGAGHDLSGSIRQAINVPETAIKFILHNQ